MRAGNLTRWVLRLTGVAVFGAAATIGGAVWAHASEDPTQPDGGNWVSEDAGDAADEEVQPAGFKLESQAPETAKWE